MILTTRRRQRFASALTALLLLWCAASASAWVASRSHSHWSSLSLGRHLIVEGGFDRESWMFTWGWVRKPFPFGGGHLHHIVSRNGHLDANDAPLFLAAFLLPGGRVHGRAGFIAAHGFNDRESVWAVAVPQWFVGGLAAVAAAGLVAFRVRTGRRARLGLCPTCGYDLRATPDRCPECGTSSRGRPRRGRQPRTT